jgi:hypothetical protein
MVYQGIKYLIRASLGRNEWALHIYYPDIANGKATLSKFTGTPQETTAAARRKIDNWLKEKKRKARTASSQTSAPNDVWSCGEQTGRWRGE